MLTRIGGVGWVGFEFCRCVFRFDFVGLLRSVVVDFVVLGNYVCIALYGGMFCF